MNTRQFVALLKNVSFVELTEYSAGFMRGRKCLGIILDSDTSPFAVLATILETCRFMIRDTIEANIENAPLPDNENLYVGGFADFMADARIDGNILYFPSYPFEE